MPIPFAFWKKQGSLILNGLVGWWKLNDVSTNSIADSSGSGFNGFNYCGPSSESGTYITFNGSCYIGFGNPTGLMPIPFTIMAWIYPTISNNTMGIFSDGIGGPYLRINSSNQLDFLKSQIIDIGQSVGTISTNVWTHVAVTYDSTNYILYINGISSGSGTFSNTFGYSQGTTIGADDGGGTEFFTGRIKLVDLFNRALSSNEIKQIYQSGAQ